MSYFDHLLVYLVPYIHFGDSDMIVFMTGFLPKHIPGKAF
jgi:hypothetical protein